MVCDVDNGVVAIPRELVRGVLELLPELAEADRRVKAAVARGAPVSQAFETHRGGLSRALPTRGEPVPRASLGLRGGAGSAEAGDRPRRPNPREESEVEAQGGA